MRKGIVKVLIVALIVVFTTFGLVACDLTQPGGNVPDDTNNIKTGKKATFDDVEKEYEKTSVKKAYATSSIEFSVFSNKKDKGESVLQKNTVGIDIVSERITKGSDSYLAITLQNGQSTTDGVVGTVMTVLNLINNYDPNDKMSVAAMKPFLGDKAIGEDTVAMIKNIAEYGEYIQGFLQNKMTLNASAGRANDVTNIKASYELRKDSGKESSEIWLLMKDELLKNVFKTELEEADFGHHMYPAALVDVAKGKDSASERLDKDGNASYDFTFTSTSILAYFSEVFDKYCDVIHIDTDAQKQEVVSAIEKILGWVSVDTSNFTAKVGNNKLPKETELTSVLTVNIKCTEAREIVSGLQEKGVLEAKQAKSISGLIGLLDAMFCGTDGTERGVIGLEFKFNAKENYAYGDKACSLSSKDKELFLAADSDKAEGRKDISDFVVELTVQEAQKAVEKLVENYGDAAAEIAEAVMEKLADYEKITMRAVKEAIAEAIKEYQEKGKEEKAE